MKKRQKVSVEDNVNSVKTEDNPIQSSLEFIQNKQNEKNKKKTEILKQSILNGRQYFGSSGASLTHQISDPAYKEKGLDATLAKIGLDGEHKTTNQLREWIKDKPNVMLVDSVHIKGAIEEEYNKDTGTYDGKDTDHLLIIGKILLIIDSKNWKKNRVYRISDKGNVLCSNKEFAGGKLKTNSALYLWRNYLREYNVSISAIVCITAETKVIIKDKNWWKQSYRLVDSNSLIEYLDMAYSDAISEENKKIVDLDLLLAVVSMTIKPYDVHKALLPNIAYMAK